MRAALIAGATFALTSLIVLPALAQDAGPAKVGQAAGAPVLTDQKGMTLYTYHRDMVGYSNCNGDCATAWPPFLADATATASGDWSIIVRDDGRRQWAYKGHALYAWTKDVRPGDAAGEGADGGKWHAAKP